MVRDYNQVAYPVSVRLTERLAELPLAICKGALLWTSHDPALRIKSLASQYATTVEASKRRAGKRKCRSSGTSMRNARDIPPETLPFEKIGPPTTFFAVDANAHRSPRLGAQSPFGSKPDLSFGWEADIPQT